MRFNYRAKTKEGKLQKGIVEAFSREGAISILQSQGLYITFLEEAEKIPIWARELKIFERITTKEIIFFTRVLATMLRSGIPIVESLRTIALETKITSFKEIIFKISDEVEAGSLFSEAISSYSPKVFSPYYVSVVKVAEASGQLPNTLNRLAEHLEKEYFLLSKVKGAMIYPTILVLASIAVSLFMVFYIVPKITPIFQEMGGQLPLITKIIINLAHFLSRNFFILVFFLTAFLVGFIIYLRGKEGKKFWHWFLLKVPLFGPILKRVYLSRFGRNLSTLLSQGLDIVEATGLSGQMIGNIHYQRMIFQARDNLKVGQSISSTLAKAPGLFPPLFVQMLSIGEKTGKLAQTSMEMSQFYEREVERVIANLLEILQPILIIFIGLIVGLLIVGILLPIYRLPLYLK